MAGKESSRVLQELSLFVWLCSARVGLSRPAVSHRGHLLGESDLGSNHPQKVLQSFEGRDPVLDLTTYFTQNTQRSCVRTDSYFGDLL